MRTVDRIVAGHILLRMSAKLVMLCRLYAHDFPPSKARRPSSSRVQSCACSTIVKGMLVRGMEPDCTSRLGAFGSIDLGWYRHK